MAGPMITRPGQGQSPWDALKLGLELPGPAGMATAPKAATQLAAGALEEIVKGMRAGKKFDPAALKQLITEIQAKLGSRVGTKGLVDVAQQGGVQPLNPALQRALSGMGGQMPQGAAQKLLGAGQSGGALVPQGGGALARQGLGGALTRTGAPMEGEILGEAVGGAAKTANPWLRRLAMLAAGTGAGYGLSQMSGDETEAAGPPPGAELLMASHGGPKPGRIPRPKPQPRMPELPGMAEGLPEGFGEQFAVQDISMLEDSPGLDNATLMRLGIGSPDSIPFGDQNPQLGGNRKKRNLFKALLSGLGKVF